MKKWDLRGRSGSKSVVHSIFTTVRACICRTAEVLFRPWVLTKFYKQAHADLPKKDLKLKRGKKEAKLSKQFLSNFFLAVYADLNSQTIAQLGTY